MMDEERLLALFRQAVREELGATRLPTMLTLKQAARELSVSVPTINRMVRCGQLVTVPVSKKPRVPSSEISRFSASRPANLPRPGVPLKVRRRLKAQSLKRSAQDELAALRELRKKR